MRRTGTRTLFVALVLAAFAAAPLVAQTPKADPARAAIDRAGKAFVEAFDRGDISAVARMYAEDAIAFPPESDMVKGRAAIEAMWQGVKETGVRSLEFEIVDVVSSGNLAAETGIATLHVQGTGAAEATLKVKYVVVWKKQGGAWKLYRDIWNAMPGPSAPATAPEKAGTPGMAMPPSAATTPAVEAPEKAGTPGMAMPPPRTKTPAAATTPHHH